MIRLTVEQYHRMIETSIISEEDSVEMLEGLLIRRPPKTPKHRIALAKLQRALLPLLPPTISLQLQEPITLSDGEPEPDGTVFDGLPEDYSDRHPGPAEISLVVEVADSTLVRDRGIKLRSYARAGLAIYWIVDLVNETVEVCQKPDSQASPPTYLQRDVHDRNSSFLVVLGGQTVGTVSVASLLP